MGRGQDEDEEGQPLCCCEYMNESGDKSHLLALCCDCQEVDEACDRLLKRQTVDKDKFSKAFSVVKDRVRIPTFFGAGAKRLDQLLDTTAIPPIVIVPAWIYLASIHIIAATILFSFVPPSILLYHRLFLRHRRRTQFFMSWGLTSVFSIYGFFYFYVSSDLSVTEFTVTTVLFVFTLMAFFKSKHGPGVVKVEQASPNQNFFKVLPESTVVSESDANLQRRNHSGSDCSTSDNGCASEKSHETSALIGREQHSGSEATNQESEDWCDVCKLLKPERAGHCRICGHCVNRLDHHCVWIDSCIGVGNHRSFLLAAVLFVFGGVVGGYQSLSTICSLQLDELLECCAVSFTNRRTAVILVSIIYTVLATICVLALLVQQFHLITHNWTYRERKLSTRSHRHREKLFELDRGLLTNWVDFLLMRQGEDKPSGGLTNV
ncbi:palmitoyltransferase ZDHHC23-B-like [Asterias amurensis]|uniref:palmitoyltransferase ZDHHC23-B-like n=1 Tax=Asterias amurensis TaxID=7602 RepID=UPI003AB390BC